MKFQAKGRIKNKGEAAVNLDKACLSARICKLPGEIPSSSFFFALSSVYARTHLAFLLLPYHNSEISFSHQSPISRKKMLRMKAILHAFVVSTTYKIIIEYKKNIVQRSFCTLMFDAQLLYYYFITVHAPFVPGISSIDPQEAQPTVRFPKEIEKN